MTAIATSEQDAEGILEGAADAVDDDRHAGDDIAAAVELEARRRPSLLLARPPRRGIEDRGTDQLDRAPPLILAEVGPQPDDDLRRALVGKEVGEARLRRPARAAQVEDDGGGEVGVAEAGSAGDAVLGRDFEHELAQLGRRQPLREPFELAPDLDHGLVEEGRGAGDLLDRPQLRQLRAGPRDRVDVGRQLPREAALEAQQAPEVVGQDQLLQVAAGEDDDRFVTEGPAQLLGRPVGGGVGVDQGVGAGVGRDAGGADRAGDRKQRRRCQDEPGVPGDPGRGGAQSIESGPVTSALRNCATKAFSESKSSSFGPDSTIFPFQSTARKSAIRRAVLRSWLIVR